MEGGLPRLYMASPELLDIVCCSLCRGVLEPATSGAAVVCTQCGEQYREKQGILDLNPEPSPSAQSEMAGHRILESQWIDTVPEALRPLVVDEAGEELLFSLPVLPHPELVQVPSLSRMNENAADFFELLDWMDIEPDEVILEIGAHMGWASHQLAERGAYVIASDISHQLAMTETFVKRGVRMERIHADMMDLPVQDGVLDTVFGVSVIHHANDLEQLFCTCARALKPGGRCVFFSEPVVGLHDEQRKAEFGAEEKEVGIQEHIYSIVDYVSAAKAAGLIPEVLPLSSVLRDANRRYRLLRAAWLGLLKTKVGYTGLFTCHIYPFLLRLYPRIPFPHMALICTKPM